MKQAMIHYIQNEKNDELYTPKEAIYPILKYLNKDLIYWECTDFGSSNITSLLRKNGFKVVNSNKKEVDFLKDTPSFDFDAIITNPPYSLKDDFLEKCYSYNKPFILLLPITSLEGIRRNKMYREYGIDLIVLDKRINYMDNKKSNWFNTSWFTKGILSNDKNKNLIVFESVDENKEKYEIMNTRFFLPFNTQNIKH